MFTFLLNLLFFWGKSVFFCEKFCFTKSENSLIFTQKTIGAFLQTWNKYTYKKYVVFEQNLCTKCANFLLKFLTEFCNMNNTTNNDQRNCCHVNDHEPPLDFLGQLGTRVVDVDDQTCKKNEKLKIWWERNRFLEIFSILLQMSIIAMHRVAHKTVKHFGSSTYGFIKFFATTLDIIATTVGLD